MNSLNTHISDKLKRLRKQRDWSLDESSQKTGVSKAMLGQIERSESSPTIATLWKIASGFGVPFSFFIEDLKPASQKAFHRQGQLKALHPSDKKFRVLPLFPHEKQLAFEAYIIEISPGFEHQSPPHQAGVIEHIIVVQGWIEVLVGQTWHRVKQREGLRFPADQAHAYRNRSRAKAIFHNLIHYVHSMKARNENK